MTSILIKLILLWTFFLGPVFTLPLIVLPLILPIGFSLRDTGAHVRFLLTVFGPGHVRDSRAYDHGHARNTTLAPARKAGRSFCDTVSAIDMRSAVFVPGNRRVLAAFNSDIEVWRWSSDLVLAVITKP